MVGNDMSSDTAPLMGGAAAQSQPPANEVVYAEYDASTGVLTLTFHSELQTEHTILDTSKVLVIGDDRASYRLTTGVVYPELFSTTIDIALNEADKLAVNGVLNCEGWQTINGAYFAVAAEPGWFEGYALGDPWDTWQWPPIEVMVNVYNVEWPEITAANYDATNHVLSVAGKHLVGTLGAANDIVVSRLTLSGEGGASHTLTSTNVDVTSASAFSVTLNDTDSAALASLFNKAGGSSTGGTLYNLAAADDWNGVITGHDISDGLGSLTVSNVPVPTIASAHYDGHTHTLVVTGSNFAALAGAGNDIDASKFSIIGAAGASHALIDTVDVDISASTRFTLTLGAADAASLALIVDQNGGMALDGMPYHLAAAEDWAAGADAAVAVADTSGNPFTASNVGGPYIVSAAYDAATGTLVVSGNAFVGLAGAANDIDASRFSFIGEGGERWTLTDSVDVEIDSASSFTLLLSAVDRAAVNLIANQNGGSASGGSGYVLDAAEDWAPGANPAVLIADQDGNAVTVSNVAVPTITAADYDAATGVMVVTGTGLLRRSGPGNDIDVNRLQVIGERGLPYVLVDTPDVELGSGLGFTLTLGSADRAQVNSQLNRHGTVSTGHQAYTLVASEDWAAGADPAVVVADLGGNSITVSQVAVPTITSASYDAATGVLVVTGTGLFSLSGDDNDIDASRFGIGGEGGVVRTLTDTPSVDITSTTDASLTTPTSFTLTLGAGDRAALGQIINRDGAVSTGGAGYTLIAAEDWAAGAAAAVVVADLVGNGLVASHVAVPTLAAASYDHATQVLTVEGTGFTQRAGLANDIDVTRLSITGEGGATYTLVSSGLVDITSGSRFSVLLSGVDGAAVGRLLSGNGSNAHDTTPFMLAAAEDWAAGADAALVVADLNGNGISVLHWAPPTITGASFDADTGRLVVTGTGFVDNPGAANDIVAARLRITGEGGVGHTLTDTTNVEVSSVGQATLQLSDADLAAVRVLLNRDGGSAIGGAVYNLAAAEDWMAGSPAAVAVADLAGNAIVVSHVATPTLVSATYDQALGILQVTGTGLQPQPGAQDDIAVSRLTFSGEGGERYTLTSGNVDLGAADSFTVHLNAEDSQALRLIVNRNGTLSTSGSAYGLAAADDWNPRVTDGDTSDPATVVVAGQVIVPRITSAIYDVAGGMLQVQGAGLAHLAGPANDIVASRLMLVGEAGATYSLIDAANAEATSSTSFTLTVGSADREALAQIMNRDGSVAHGGAAFQLVAAEDWAASADPALQVADLGGNPVTVVNAAGPTITGARYDAASGLLEVFGRHLQATPGPANDIAVDRLALQGEGGQSHPLTSADVELDSASGFHVRLDADDRAWVNTLLNRNGSVSTGGLPFQLVASDDWNALVTSGDTHDSGAPLSVDHVARPTITAASYDREDGRLVVTGSGLLRRDGADNDIDLSGLRFVGQGGAAHGHTLTSAAGVDIRSGTEFVLLLPASDKAAVDALLNRDGARAFDGNAYRLIALDGWAAGADAALDTADTEGNPIEVFGAAPLTPGPDQPFDMRQAVDGTTLVTTSRPNGDGSATVTQTVEPIAPNRVDHGGSAHPELADIPLSSDLFGRPLLAVGLPVGVGLVAVGASGSLPGLPQQLQRALGARIDDPASAVGVQQLIEAYLAAVPAGTSVSVRTLTLTMDVSAPATVAPIIVVGAGAGHPTQQKALVIDGRLLPAGSTLHLDGVAFAVIIGPLRVLGGGGRNWVSGDGAAQYLMLGEADDLLRGGGGDDTVASNPGSDLLFGDTGNDWLVGGSEDDVLDGGSGNDVLQGGQSDAGAWHVLLDPEGTLITQFTPRDTVLTALAEFRHAGAWVDDDGAPVRDERLAFSQQPVDQLASVALLHQAVLHRLPSLDELNHYGTLGADAPQLAQWAYEAYLRLTGPLPQAVPVQVTALIESVWGSGSATPSWVAAGTQFITGGGSWAEALLFLALAEPGRAGVRLADGSLPLAQVFDSGELGWAGDSGSDVLRGGEGNDRLVGGAGDDVLDGGAGVDLAVFTGRLADQTLLVRLQAGTRQVVLTDALTGDADVLSAVELLQFGARFFALHAEVEALPVGTVMPLSQLVTEWSVLDVQLVGIPGV